MADGIMDGKKVRRWLTWLLLWNPAIQASDLPDPSVQITRVNERGISAPLTWKHTSSWLLLRLNEKPYRILVIQTEVKVPDRYKILGVGWKQTASTGILGQAQTSGNNLTLNTLKPISGGNIKVLDTKTGKKTEFGLIISASASKPVPYLTSDCREHGMSLKQWRHSNENFYFSVHCVKHKKNLEVFIQRPPNISMNVRSTGVTRKKQPIYYQVEIPLRQKNLKVGAIAAISMRKSRNMKESFYNLYLGKRSKKRTLSLFAGLGSSYLKYSESPLSPQDVRKESVVLTVKVSAGYPLSKKLDLAGNAFGNVFTLSESAPSIPAARFFGMNSRLGYVLTKKKNLLLKGSLGWYAWGMYGHENLYGATLVSGPQVFVSSTYTGWGKPLGAYLKFAVISHGPGISLTNRELAGGLAYPLGLRLPGGAPVSLTLDVAHMEFQLDGALNKIELFSTSLGFQFPILK